MDKLTNDMDFSTRQIDPSHWPSLEGRYWLRAAMATVVAVDFADVIAQEGGDASFFGGGRHYPLGLHSHPFAEICLGLAGRAMLDFEHRCYELKPSKMAILSPGVMHCEGYFEESEPYSLFWLGGSGVALAARVHAYRPGVGWRALGSWNVATADVERLFVRMKKWGEAAGPEHLELIRSDLLLILSGLYQQATESKIALGPDHPNIDTGHLAILKNLQTMIANHLGEQLLLDDLADLFGMSPNYLNSLFSRWSGESIHRYLIRLRMEKAIVLLRQGNHMVKQVAHEVGYSDALYFSRAFRRYHGLCPSEVV